MPSNGVPERDIRNSKRPTPLDISFDFVIAERPIYVPNSGPPLAPLTIMPAHDKDGIITEKVPIHGGEVYVVTYRDKPQLRVAVRPENIRDWVSARTLENWEWDQEGKFVGEEEAPLLAIKQQKKTKKSRGKPGRPGKRKRAETDTPVTKRPPMSGFGGHSSGPARKRQQVEEEKSIWTSPNALKQAKGPSLVSPSKGVGLLNTVIDTDFSTDEDDTDNAITTQLNAATRNSSIPSGGNTSTPDPLATLQTSRLVPFKAAQSVSTRESSVPESEQQFLTQCISSQESSQSQPDGTQNTDNSTSAELRASRKDSIAKSSSLLAFQLYEELEHKDKGKKVASTNGKPLTISQKYSHFRRAPTMFPQSPEDKNIFFKAAKGSSPQSNHTLEDQGEVLSSEDEDYKDEEWEVDYIKADKRQKASDGKRKLHYLIKWVGDWGDSWEPAENVSFDAIQSYEGKQLGGKNASCDKVSSVSEEVRTPKNQINQGKAPQKNGNTSRKFRRATPRFDRRREDDSIVSGGKESSNDSPDDRAKNPLPSPTEQDSDPDTLFLASRKRKLSNDTAASIPWKRVKNDTTHRR
ncbi:hypothetical protein BGZ60DRAFT_531724 [Tricladium varicosporioides]|nr:hypothetical protein BGZ60DRAFT_531724 [Hymenoscyphus varicosporioides]